MKNQQHSKSERLWAYVHGQLDEAGRLEVEDVVSHDAQLLRELETIRSLDRKLKAFVPLTQLTEDDFEKKVLEAWEASAEASTPSSRPGTIHSPLVGPTQRSWWRAQHRRATQTILALAAAFTVMLGIRNYTSGPLDWQTPEIGVSVYRGENGAEPFYSSDELKSFSGTLRESIRKNYVTLTPERTRSWLRKNTQWVIVAKLQELRPELLYVQVEAYHPQHKTLAREWSAHYSGSDRFLAGVDDLGAQIAEDLADLTGHGSVH